jgi:hypothetical protein
MMLEIACDAEEVIATLKQLGGIARNRRKGLRKQYGADFGIVTIEYRKKARLHRRVLLLEEVVIEPPAGRFGRREPSEHQASESISCLWQAQPPWPTSR